MILVCDNEINARTKALHRMLYKAGYPCAEVSVKEIGDFLPAKLIVCYYEAFDNIRRGPYDNIFAIVIGKGFVNSALNAVRVDNEEEACIKAKEYIRKLFGIGESETYEFGVLVDSSVFMAKKYIEIYGNIIELPISEYMIFKYFLAFAGEGYYFTPQKIRKFCYIRTLRNEDNIEGNVSVHIHNLNRAIMNVYGKTFIKAKRYIGYYALEL